jgi:hypothetical protein
MVSLREYNELVVENEELKEELEFYKTQHDAMLGTIGGRWCRNNLNVTI